MPTNRNARYPYHLAQLVSHRLTCKNVVPPSEKVLLRLFETLYFASLKTDEARPCRCTINFVDPDVDEANRTKVREESGWSVVRFQHPQPLDVRALCKLAGAADPNVSSLAVFGDDDGGLFIWGMVDQELRYGDYVALDATGDPQRPGSFQATITGVGCVSVYKDYVLLGSLEQQNLVEEYHDVLWEGPVHEHLKDNLHAILVDKPSSVVGATAPEDIAQVEEELLVRWQNAVCRLLFNIEQYGHGGGLLIVPRRGIPGVHVKYELTYDRLPKTLFRLAQHQFLKRHATDVIARHCRHPGDVLPCEIHWDAVEYQRELERLKNELLGCVRFIASLSRVDGFILLDRSLVVLGFGVEVRSDAELAEIHIAGDAKASSHLLRKAPLSQFGTRHRAMLRYCDQTGGTLGFVISQDGDIRATLKCGERLVLWENINVQLAYRNENDAALNANVGATSISSFFQHWTQLATDFNA